jgi:hypothetical protein
MNNFLNAKELKEQASLVDLLARLGYKPVRKSGNGKEQIYKSMLRDDDTHPSFSVDDQLGAWYDHGTGKGGNIIDFGLNYWNGLSFNDVVDKINLLCGTNPDKAPHENVRNLRARKPVKIPHYIIEEIKDLGTHPAITDYIKSRGVYDIAIDRMSEVYYYVVDDKGLRKHFFAAGWKNENGSWEVRNKYFKGCLGHKGLTFIPGHEKKLAVFEGYINYLSWKTENPSADQSVLILNTLALLVAGIAKAKEFSSIDVYFDRDAPGHTATNDFVKVLPYAADRSESYVTYNDYNDKLIAVLQGKPVVDASERKQKTAYSI